MKGPVKLAAFCVAGGAGFVADTGILHLLVPVLGPYIGRAVSFVAAVVTTWLINRNLAFAGQSAGMPLWREFLAYLGAMIGGGVLNYGVYAVLVATVPLVATYPAFGVFAGTLVGLGWNFVSANRLVFSKSAR